MATGATPKHLSVSDRNIALANALAPSKLLQFVNSSDCVAVFGSSHSAMIIIKNLLDAGVDRIINFYLSPIKYAVRMSDYTLYDNTGLKGETAAWVREHISHNPHVKVERYISNEENIKTYLEQCNKIVYAIGFDTRAPLVKGVNVKKYDTSNGIIAPGLFGVGIGFPKKVIDPNGNQELNVGLYKFMNDIRTMLPIWQQYDL